MNTLPQPSSCPRIKRRGFTLIELLVVISIIALLISILLPALSSARVVAKQVTCTSNIRQMSIASFSYIADHDGVVPLYGLSHVDPGVNPRPASLVGYLPAPDTYAKTFEKIACPSKGAPGTVYDGPATSMSYSLNSVFGTDFGATWPYWGPIKQSLIVKPSTTMLAMEAMEASRVATYTFAIYERPLDEGRHEGTGLNFAFNDGSAHFLLAGRSGLAYNNPDNEWRTRTAHYYQGNVTGVGLGDEKCGLGGCLWHPY